MKFKLFDKTYTYYALVTSICCASCSKANSIIIIQGDMYSKKEKHSPRIYYNKISPHCIIALPKTIMSLETKRGREIDPH